MSSYPLPKSGKRAHDDGDDARAHRKADLAKEFRHIKAGIWDMYEQIPHSKFSTDVPWISNITRNLEIVEDLPFFWRMVKDVLKMKSCRYHLCLFILVKILLSLQPAVTLWCVVQRAIYIVIPLTPSAQVHQSLPHRCSYFLFLIHWLSLTRC